MQQAAEIAGIEPELAAERADVNAIGADFENEPRLRQRAASPQIIDLERADAPGHQAIEAANAVAAGSRPLSDFSQIYSDFKPAKGPSRSSPKSRRALANDARRARPCAARQFVIGVGGGRREGNDCGAAANGVSLTASVNSARRPCRASHLASRFASKRKKRTCRRAARERASRHNVEGYGAPWSGDYDAKRGIRTSVRALAPYLDVAPMISALRFQPSDFEYAHGWLNHVPSRHRFQFDRKGRVTIDALCGCASLSVRPEQADELHSMFKIWRQNYWQPLEMNREFASHFAEPNAWMRLFRDIRMAWRRFRRQADPVTIPADVLPSATPRNSRRSKRLKSARRRRSAARTFHSAWPQRAKLTALPASTLRILPVLLEERSEAK